MPPPLNEQTKTIVALFAFGVYAAPPPSDAGSTVLGALPGVVERQRELRKLFSSDAYKKAGFEVLEFEPCTNRDDVTKRLEAIRTLVKSQPKLNVVLLWSSHGQVFDRALRLATPDCVAPLDEGSGLPASEVIIQAGAKSAQSFCVFLDACESAGAVIELSQVIQASLWTGAQSDYSFSAYFSSYPYERAKDGVFLEILFSVLTEGPSQKAETQLYEDLGCSTFNSHNLRLTASDLDMALNAEVKAQFHNEQGLTVPPAIIHGRQALFPNPKFNAAAGARLVEDTVRTRVSHKDFEAHFLPKARGIEQTESGWHFTGRVEATRHILRWLQSGPSADSPNLYGLTAEAGTGKSALIGRLIALSDKNYRQAALDAGWHEKKDEQAGTVPPLNGIDAALHLRNLTAQTAVEQLAEILQLPRPESPEKFIESAPAHPPEDSARSVRIVLDALDEAEGPSAIALRVVRPLVRHGWRVLVATRPSSASRGAGDLLSLLGPAQVQHLDQDAQSASDIEAYVCGRLRASKTGNFVGNEALISAASQKVAERANNKFLYARVCAASLVRNASGITLENLDQHLAADVNGALAQEFAEIDREFQAHFDRQDCGGTALLAALSRAQGDGLPMRDGIWAAIATAIAQPFAPYENKHVFWLLREAGRFILESGDGEQAVYRLYHQSLGEYFLAQRDSAAPQEHAARASEDRIANGLQKIVDENGGWPRANSYLVRHFATHLSARSDQQMLIALLFNFEWMHARLNTSGVQALVDDFAYVDKPDEAVSRLQRTLSGTAHILDRRPEELVSQLHGRLASNDGRTSQLLLGATQGIDRVTLWPRFTSLTQASTLIRVVPGHEHWVSSVAFSPDGTRLASGSWDNTIRLWDVRMGAALGEPLRGHEGRVNSVAFSPDGTRLASGGEDNTIRLWDAHTGAALGEPLRGHEGRVNSVAFSPDGARLASGGEDNTIRLWDAHTGAALGEPLRGHEGRVNSVAFSPDGTRLASGGGDNTIRLWDAHTGAALGEPLRGHEGRVNSVAFSPDGTRLASGGGDNTIRLWDVHTGAALGEPLRGHEEWVSSVAFSPDGTRLASGGVDSTIRLWDAHTGAALGEPLRGHGGMVNSIAFSPDGTRLASGGWDNTIRLWDVRTGAGLGEPLRGHEGRVSSVAFSPDGTRLASGGWDNTIRLWDVRTGAALGEPLRGHEGRVNSVAFSPDGTRLASGGWDTIRLWDVGTGAALGEPLHCHEYWVDSVAFSPDGTRLASGGGDNTIRLWDAHTGAAWGEPLRGHEEWVSSVAFSPDGTRLASGGGDNTIRLWDVRTGAALGEPLHCHENGVDSVAFSPDGTRLASGGRDNTIRLWDVRTGAALGEPLRGHEDWVSSVAFSPDGTRLASGGGDNTIRLWDARTHQCLARLTLDVWVSSIGVTIVKGEILIAAASGHGEPKFVTVVAPASNKS